MSFINLKSYIDHLESKGDLLKISTQVDPVLEITLIQHKVMAENGPALLFENVKGSPYRLASNLFGTDERLRTILGKDPEEIGEGLLNLSEQLMPPSASTIWKQKKSLFNIANSRLREVHSGPVLDTITEPAKLTQLPCLTCWPLDGGPFFTLPLVHTVEPGTGKGNLGIYRMQRYDDESTGMHWQIEKGGGFHFARAIKNNEKLPLSVTLGGPPVLTIAAIAPLPEGIDERLLASYLLGKPLNVIKRPSGHKVSADAEFIIEGYVTPNDNKKEGPFGDHLGHYSHSADFPVFRVERVLARNNAIYPATVVGKPPQEDLYIGNALQKMFVPLLKIVHKGITDLWSYPETGFHPLAVAAVKERYKHEGLKHALAILGEGQLSLTKTLIILSENENVKDFTKVSEELWRNLDSDRLTLLSPTAQDTLDFTGPGINLGSRLILVATKKTSGPVRTNESPPLPDINDNIHPSITELNRLGPAILIVKVKNDVRGDNKHSIEKRDNLIKALQKSDPSSKYLFHILVSDDVDINNEMSTLWGWFTRFDPFRDMHPASKEVKGNKLVLNFPVTIDSQWKKGYRKPVEFNDETIKLVEKKWTSYGF